MRTWLFDRPPEEGAGPEDYRIPDWQAPEVVRRRKGPVPEIESIDVAARAAAPSRG